MDSHTLFSSDIDAVFTRSRMCIEANRALLATSRYRIAASRRRLNGHFAVCGGASPPSAETVRAMLASGALFPINGHRVIVHAGAGSGKKVCILCQGRIDPSDLEYNVERGEQGLIACHFGCFTLWRAESCQAARS